MISRTFNDATVEASCSLVTHLGRGGHVNIFRRFHLIRILHARVFELSCALMMLVMVTDRRSLDAGVGGEGAMGRFPLPWAFYNFVDHWLAIVPCMAAARSSGHPTDTTHPIGGRGAVRSREAHRGRVVASHLQARLEALRVVDRLLVVKHALAFVVGGPRHLFLSLLDRVKEGLPLGFGESAARVDLLFGEEHLFQVGVVVGSWDQGPGLEGAFVQVDAALLPPEVRVDLSLDPVVRLHVLRRHVDVVTGGAGRVILPLLPPAALRLLAGDRDARLLLLAQRVVHRLSKHALVLWRWLLLWPTELGSFGLVSARPRQILPLLIEVLTA